MPVKRGWYLILFLAGLAVVLSSCTSGPAPPKPGTPLFYWGAARETFAAGDFLKTSDHLEQLCRTQNEHRAKAQPWRLILSNGLASAFMDVAQQYEHGARANTLTPAIFRRLSSDNRTRANRFALLFAQAFVDFNQKQKDDPVNLTMTFPKGNIAVPSELTKAANGVIPKDSDVVLISRRSVERGILLATCDAVGAPEDTAKTQEILKAGEAKIPRATFMLAMAKSLHSLADLYSRDKIGQPDKEKIFLEQAQAAMEAVPESKASKELTKKLLASLKKAGIKKK